MNAWRIFMEIDEMPAAAAKKKTGAKKNTKKAAPKKPKEAPAPVMEEAGEEHVHEHEEGCSCCGGVDYSEKNGPRSYVLRDIWYESLSDVISKEIMPEENKREMLFLTLSNAILDLVMDIVPEDYAKVIADNIDDFLAVTVVNKENDLDLLDQFKLDFIQENGDSFEDEDELHTKLEAFEDKWWNAKRKDLNDMSPNEALEDAAKRYNLQ